jgi:hypothetical protein
LNATWTPANPNASIPKVYSDNTVNDQVSDFFLQKADYLRIKAIQLGYTLPLKLTKVVRLDKVRVYVNLENYFILTGYPGQDPENNDQTYPIMKTMSFGLNMSF